MLVRSRHHRVLAFALVAVVALTLAASLGGQRRASAHVPHPGLDFSFEIDTNGDTVAECGTGFSQLHKCTATRGSILHARVFLNSLGGVQYGGFDIRLDYAGVTSKDNPDGHAWPPCTFQALNIKPTMVDWGCARGLPPAPDSTYTGLIGTTDFNCTNGGTITMVGGDVGFPGTDIVASGSLETHSEGRDARETLTINCVIGPVATPASVGGLASDVSAGRGSASFEWAVVAFAGLAVISVAGLGLAAVRRRVS